MTIADTGGEPAEADPRAPLTDRKRVRWTNEMKTEFLDHLASTCHVLESARSIGVEPVSVYALRRRDAQFAADWGKALAAGYEMLETLVVGHVLSGREERQIVEGRYGPIDLDQALRLLSHHRGAMLGKPRVSGRKPSVAMREETNAAILKKLIAIEKRKGLA